jgi:hypothetical protein
MCGSNCVPEFEVSSALATSYLSALRYGRSVRIAFQVS